MSGIELSERNLNCIQSLGQSISQDVNDYITFQNAFVDKFTDTHYYGGF